MAKHIQKVRRVGVKVMIIEKYKDDHGHPKERWVQFGFLQPHLDAANQLATTLPAGTRRHIEGVRVGVVPHGDGLPFIFTTDKPKAPRRAGAAGCP